MVGEWRLASVAETLPASGVGSSTRLGFRMSRMGSLFPNANQPDELNVNLTLNCLSYFVIGDNSASSGEVGFGHHTIVNLYSICYLYGGYSENTRIRGN